MWILGILNSPDDMQQKEISSSPDISTESSGLQYHAASMLLQINYTKHIPRHNLKSGQVFFVWVCISNSIQI